MHFSRKQEVFCPIVVGLYPPLGNRELRSTDVFTQTCRFTVCSLRYFKLESSHFLEKEQGIIYRVHLLFPNVKYLKFSLRERYAKSCVLLSNQSIFSFPPYEKDRQRGFPRRIFHLPNLKMGVLSKSKCNKSFVFS